MKSSEIATGPVKATPVVASAPKPANWDGTAITIGCIAGLLALPIVLEASSLIHSKLK